MQDMYGTKGGATQTSFVIPIPSTDQGVSHYIDLFQCLSLINRRMYEQGKILPVQISLDHGVDPSADYAPPGQLTSLSAGTVMSWQLEFLPNNWPLRQAYALGREKYFEATSEARKELKVAKWQDFKVHFDRNHLSAGGAANLLPTVVRADGTTVLQTTGWEYTEVPEIEGTNHYHFGFFGGSDAHMFGMLTEYTLSMLASQAYPDPPGVSTDTPYQEALAQVDEDSAQFLQGLNETPPYDGDVPQYHKQRYTIGFQNLNATSGAAFYMKGQTPIVLAPCGLVRITNTSGQAHSASIRVDVLAGADRGVEAESMLHG